VTSYPYFNGTGLRIRLYPQIDGIMKRWPALQYGHRLHYSVDLRIQTYTEQVPLKYRKLAKNIRGYTDIFPVYFHVFVSVRPFNE